MSNSYTLASQNNDALSALSSKVSALRGVTVDIFDQASDRTLINANQDAMGGMLPQLKGSITRLGRTAQAGNKMAILKLAGIIVGVVLVLYWVLGWLFSGGGGEGKA
jgi:blocked-early-in-transport protein 1